MMVSIGLPRSRRATSRVLAATDLADTDPVLGHALLVAEALGGEVVLVHALSVGAEDPSRLYAKAVAACETVGDVGPRISRTTVLRFGEADELVALSSKELGAALVVMGASSPPGPVARGVLRACSCPIWIARGAPEVSRINAASGGHELTQRLASGLQLPIVREAPRAGDLVVVDVSELPALSRLHAVQVALKRHAGPLLVFPSSEGN